MMLVMWSIVSQLASSTRHLRQRGPDPLDLAPERQAPSRHSRSSGQHPPRAARSRATGKQASDPTWEAAGRQELRVEPSSTIAACRDSMGGVQ